MVTKFKKGDFVICSWNKGPVEIDRIKVRPPLENRYYGWISEGDPWSAYENELRLYKTDSCRFDAGDWLIWDGKVVYVKRVMITNPTPNTEKKFYDLEAQNGTLIGAVNVKIVDPIACRTEIGKLLYGD